MSRYHDYSDDEGDYNGRNPNRVRGGQKAAETRRKRGTGYFENNSKEKQAELGRRGGQIGGRSTNNRGSEHYNESYEQRRERGLKAAKTREERGTDFFKNAKKDGRLSEIGRKGGRRSFGDESDQDEDEQDAYEPTRQSRYDEDDDEDDSEDYDQDDEEDDHRGRNPNRVRGGQKAAETRKRRGTARGN